MTALKLKIARNCIQITQCALNACMQKTYPNTDMLSRLGRVVISRNSHIGPLNQIEIVSANWRETLGKMLISCRMFCPLISGIR